VDSDLSIRRDHWFFRHNWQPFDFQKEVWQAMAAGESGLLHAPTGMGKTLAVWFGTLARLEQSGYSGLSVVWLTPLRALAADTAAALTEVLPDCQVRLRVEVRTGDTSAHRKQKQEKKMPEVLVTTPESLTLLLTRTHAGKTMRNLRVVIVDEWHELLGSKRGIQTELALARLRLFAPDLLIWGLSATLANLDEALFHLLGAGPKQQLRPGRLISAAVEKPLVIDALLPESTQRFPWAGHLGLNMVDAVLAELEDTQTALVFTNTRSQCELWYQAISEARPQWPIGLHHGSLSTGERTRAEQGLKDGSLKLVVCTSSLDLGVDFSPVDRVLQVGSPKGVARLLQRAGRSGHGPGRTSRVTCVPASAFELIESAAARAAALAGQIEGRMVYQAPLDVLVQHAVSMALSGGFDPDELYGEITATAAYHDLPKEQWQWLLTFLVSGGQTLAAYSEYHKLVYRDGRYVVEDATIARRHRMSIGTIVSDNMVQVRYARGGSLGSVEESFIAKLFPGDRFSFGGKSLELVRVHNMVAYVRSTTRSGKVPVWYGGRMPLSSQLAQAVCEKLDEAANDVYRDPEMKFVQPILELQRRWSAIPRLGQTLCERITSREGHHLFLYPFGGRLVHEGLAALLAHRLAARTPLTISWSINDYGIELLCSTEPPFTEALASGLFSSEHLGADIMASLNGAELAKSKFREIARIAGLVFEGYPGKSKTARQIQTTSSLIFDVFSRYDPDHPLLRQSYREVLDRQLEHSRLMQTLKNIESSELLVTEPARMTPLAFPLMVDRLREKLTSEKLQDRIARMLAKLEKQADR
jgi:ATP-dependent Lhr-like helicase